MRLPALRNRGTIASLLTRFERRFHRIDGGVIYCAQDGGDGVRLSEAEAADLIAGMRRTLIEADGDELSGGFRPWGWDAIPAIIAIDCAAVIFGTMIGFPAAAMALVLPLTLALVAMGPVLGLVRVHFASQRALARVAEELAARDRMHPDEVRRGVPSNPVRPVFAVVALGIAAVFAGLMIAAALGPLHVKLWIDDLIAGWVMPAVMVVVVLALVSHGIDATRRRVSEAAIADAMGTRRRRPLD